MSRFYLSDKEKHNMLIALKIAIESAYDDFEANFLKYNVTMKEIKKVDDDQNREAATIAFKNMRAWKRIQKKLMKNKS